jgi:hypothetical protein
LGGWVYLAFVVDVFAQETVAWKAATAKAWAWDGASTHGHARRMWETMTREDGAIGPCLGISKASIFSLVAVDLRSPWDLAGPDVKGTAAPS